MLGAIIGDIVGSIYEFDNIKKKDFPFFQERMEYTDDSILTIATADWLLKGGSSGDFYLKYATDYPYPMGSYGTMFVQWVHRSRRGTMQPYNSCGNGSAMRVGPVGWAFATEQETMNAAKASAECTHNHPEGIKGAQATALAIFMARNGASIGDIKTAIEMEFGYNIGFTLDELRPEYSWNYPGAALCQGTVPQAIRCVYEATSYEDAIRNAISLGGDSDTLACIAGAIAEPVFGIPKKIYTTGMNILKHYFPEPYELVVEFEKKYGNRVLEG
jgi:ADP-ribosylglycohydrolase